MEVTQKEYDYDEVIKFTGSGGELDQALSTLQGHLVNLYDKIKESSSDNPLWLNVTNIAFISLELISLITLACSKR